MTHPHLSTLLGLLSALSLGACAPEGGGSGGAQAAEGAGQGLVFVEEGVQTSDPIGVERFGNARPYFHDFGNVMDGADVSTVFRLRNTDPAPVNILKVQPSCGCTVPRLHYRDAAGNEISASTRPRQGGEPLATIPPGGICEIELAVETSTIKAKNTDKLLTTTITTDSPNRYYIQLEAHLVVEKPFAVVPNGINLGRVPRNGGGRGDLKIVLSPGFERRLTEILSIPDGAHADLTYDEMTGAPQWTLEAGFLPPLELGQHSGKIVIGSRNADGSEADPLEVPIVGISVRDIEVQPSRFAFRAAPDASFQVRLATLIEGQRLRILGAELPGEHQDMLALELAPDTDAHGYVASSPDESAAWFLTLRLVGHLPAGGDPLRGEVKLSLSDPENPEIEVAYVVHPPAG